MSLTHTEYQDDPSALDALSDSAPLLEGAHLGRLALLPTTRLSAPNLVKLKISESSMSLHKFASIFHSLPSLQVLVTRAISLTDIVESIAKPHSFPQLLEANVQMKEMYRLGHRDFSPGSPLLTLYGLNGFSVGEESVKHLEILDMTLKSRGEFLVWDYLASSGSIADVLELTVRTECLSDAMVLRMQPMVDRAKSSFRICEVFGES